MKDHRLLPVILLLAGVMWPTVCSAQATVNENQESAFLYVDTVNGSDTNPGTQTAPFQTIGKAWTVAQSNNQASIGTQVNINPGTYRESVTMNASSKATSAPITIQAVTAGTVVWSGGQLYTGWNTYSGNSSIYTHAWTNNYPLCSIPGTCSQYLQQEIILHQEMATVNGTMLTQVLSLGQVLYPGTFYVDSTHSTIYVWPPTGTSMSTATVDIPSLSSLLSLSNISNIVFRGIVFQYANTCRSNAAVTVNNGSNVLFDNDTFQYNNGQGIAFNNPATYFTVQNSVSQYNGDSGFQSSQTRYGLWSNNIAEYNNWRGAQGAFYNCNVAGQHVWMAHTDQVLNSTYAWNQTYGIHWDTDNKNITTSGLIAADNVLSGVFIEKDEGPISLAGAYICNHTSAESVGGLKLRNAGYDGNGRAVTPGISLTNSYLYNNYSAQIVVQGLAGGIAVSDWETGANYNLITGNFTNTGNTIQGVGSGQLLLSDTYLNGSDWTDFQGTLTSNTNDWWNGDNTGGAWGLPWPNLGVSADFPTWQSDTAQDLFGSSFSAPSGNPFSACTSISAPVKKSKNRSKTSGIPDFWLTVDNNTASTDVTGLAVYNLTVTALNGFAGTANLSLDGVSAVAGLTSTLSPSSITGSGTSVLTLNTTVGSTPSGTYTITIIANSGNLTRTLSVQVVIVALQLEYSTSTVTFPNTQRKKTGTATLTITNKGTTSVSFTSYTVNNTVYNPGIFSIASNGCPASGGTLGAGKNCTVTLNFSPNAAQAFSGATFSVVDNDPSSPQVISLTGTGTGVGLASFSSYSLSFGNVLKGTTSSPMTVTLTNTGDGTLNISKMDVEGGTYFADYSLSNNTCIGALNVLASCTFNVTFTPSITGSESGSLVYVYDDASTSSQTITLNGSGALPTVSFTPSPLAFSNVLVGTSVTLTDTIANTGSVPLTITNIALTGTNTQYYSFTHNCPLNSSTLAAGASCVATVTFSPTVSGALNSTLTLTDNVSAGSSALSLTGNGSYPIANFTPGTLGFNSVLVGTSSTMTDTIKNTGSVPLTITNIAPTGSNSQYYSSSDTCPRSPNTLAVNASCVATVIFTPTVSGALNSTLTITDNASGGSSALSLTGSGAYPTVSFTPGTLAFNTVQVGVSSTLSDTVKNTGSVPLTITSIALTGSNTSNYTFVNNTCPISPNTLTNGATCTVTVTFTPTTNSSQNSTLTFNDNVSGGTSNLSLTGTGTYPKVSFTPSPLAFGNVLVPTSSTLSDTIKNTGTVPLTITSIALTGSNTKYYSFTHNCPTSPSTLAVNASCVATVTFTPTVSGSLNSTLTVYGNMSGGNSALSLTGTGKYPTVSFTPGTLAFGNVQVGYSSTLIDTIKNTGLVPLTITKIALTGSNTSNYSYTHNCPLSPSTLAVNATCVATVTFTPTASGALNSTLTLTDNVSTGSSALSLTGTGKYPSASLSPGSYTFPTISVGSSESNTFTLTNNSTSGAWILNISSITITGANQADFVISTNTCGSSLAQNASCTVTVTFTPTLKSSESATLNVSDNTSAGSNTSSLTGTGK